jgi:geranylgeranyl pyrophosphate synthase
MELSVEYGARIKDRVDAELASCVAEWFPELPPPDQDALRAILARGKRLRACLACLVAEALGAGMEAAMPAALAIEMVHAASLVHDDFVDGDALRHGKPAAWTVLAPRRAVLLADMMFATAIERMAHCGPAEVGALAHAIAATARSRRRSRGALPIAASTRRRQDRCSPRRRGSARSPPKLAPPRWRRRTSSAR